LEKEKKAEKYDGDSLLFANDFGGAGEEKKKKRQENSAIVRQLKRRKGEKKFPCFERRSAHVAE